MLLLKKQNNLFFSKRFAYQTANPTDATPQQAAAPVEQPQNTPPKQAVSPAVQPVASLQRGRVELAQQLPPRPFAAGDTAVAKVTSTEVSVAPSAKPENLPNPVETGSNTPSKAIPAQSQSLTNAPAATQAVTPAVVDNLAKGAEGLVDKVTGWATQAFAMLGPLFEKLGPLLEKISTIWTLVKNKIKSVLPASLAKSILPDEDGSVENQSSTENPHKGKVDSTLTAATQKFQERLTLSGQINLGLNSPYALHQTTKFICDSLGIADQGSPEKLLATLKNSGATIVDSHETTGDLKPGDLIAFKTEDAEGKYQLTHFGIISAISDQGIKYKALPTGMSGPASSVEMQFSPSDKFFGFIRLPDGLNRQIKGGPMQGVSATPAGGPNLPAGALLTPAEQQPGDKSKLFDTAFASIEAAMIPSDKGIKDYDNGGIFTFNEKEGPTYKGLKGMLLAYYTTLGAAAAENQFKIAKRLFDTNKNFDQMLTFENLSKDMGLGKYLDQLNEINTDDSTIKGYLAGLLKILDEKMGTVPGNFQTKLRTDYLAYLISEFKPLNEAGRLLHLKEIKDPETFRRSSPTVTAQNSVPTSIQSPLEASLQPPNTIPQVPPTLPT